MVVHVFTEPCETTEAGADSGAAGPASLHPCTLEVGRGTRHDQDCRQDSPTERFVGSGGSYSFDRCLLSDATMNDPTMYESVWLPAVRFRLRHGRLCWVGPQSQLRTANWDMTLGAHAPHRSLAPAGRGHGSRFALMAGETPRVGRQESDVCHHFSLAGRRARVGQTVPTVDKRALGF